MTEIPSHPVTIAEYNATRAAAMTEKQLQNVIIQEAKRFGWLAYHTFDSRRSEPGYPDLHLIHPTRKLSIFRELKTQTGRLSAAQVAWIDALTAAGCDIAIWRPIDWMNNTISNLLTNLT